jgi:hypothetical protein
VYLEFWESVWIDGEFFNRAIQFEIGGDVLGNAKVLCEGVGTGHVMAVGIGALGWRGGGDERGWDRL